MENYITFIDHGFDLAAMEREGLRIHVCFFNDECYALDCHGQLSTDLTDEMLLWYLANKAKKEDEDHSIKLTEVCYETCAGEAKEIMRRETTYSNELMEVFMGIRKYPPANVIMDDIESLPF